jgi:hypothetical protein
MRNGIETLSGHVRCVESEIEILDGGTEWEETEEPKERWPTGVRHTEGSKMKGLADDSDKIVVDMDLQRVSSPACRSSVFTLIRIKGDGYFDGDCLDMLSQHSPGCNG